MTTLTYRTPPAPIRAHLARKHTTCHHADARIEQAFFPGGWATVTGQPFPSPSAIRQLRDRGATCIAVGYNLPPYVRNGEPVRPRADFTIRECLS
jgi:hypothetical protein